LQLTRYQIGECLALLTALCWTVSSLAFESASRRAGSLPVNLLRMLVAFAGLSIVGLLSSRNRALPTDAPADAWRWLLLSGVVGFFIGDLALFRAFVIIGARLSTLLMSLAPPIAALVGISLLDERISVLGWVGMFVTLAGIVLVVSERMRDHETGEHRHHSPWGIALGVIGAAGQAVGLVLSKRGMEQFDHPFAATQIRAIAGIALFALLIVAARDVGRVFRTLTNGRAMLMLTLGAIAGPFLGVSLLLMSLEYGVPTGVAQTMAAMVPVMILPFVIVIKREHVSWRAAIGAAVAVAGIAIMLVLAPQANHL
jgi:drug/metabolite transporter (DMT)-like permease